MFAPLKIATNPSTVKKWLAPHLERFSTKRCGLNIPQLRGLPTDRSRCIALLVDSEFIATNLVKTGWNCEQYFPAYASDHW
ncbi:hypothetical protein Bpro_4980 (plasmid) [Polaromonas sp. JS666]|nr:hypothetical protein Bpro_4980 [Polaromonas sp. JS666]